MKYTMTDGQLDPPANPQVVGELSSKFEVDFPSDYLDFLKSHNGGEGFIGKKYIVLWKAEELFCFNREYEVERYAPDVVLFGSSGGGEGYGFDFRSPERLIIRIPFIGMGREEAEAVAENFPDFFDKLAL